MRLAERRGLPADPATPEELAAAIVTYVERNDHVTFAELARFWPDYFRAEGGKHLATSAAPNVILWTGLSDLSCDAMDIVQERVTTEPKAAACQGKVAKGIGELQAAALGAGGTPAKEGSLT